MEHGWDTYKNDITNLYKYLEYNNHSVPQVNSFPLWAQVLVATGFILTSSHWIYLVSSSLLGGFVAGVDTLEEPETLGKANFWKLELTMDLEGRVGSFLVTLQGLIVSLGDSPMMHIDLPNIW
jgi:hypothetical protein